MSTTDPLRQFDLSGRVALVTGGSRGLGREIAFGLARCGADVMISSRRLESCQATAQDIAAETGRRAVPFACHVGEWDQVDALADAAYAEFGRVDVLVNNAGMSPLYPDAVSVSEALWDKIVGVNLKGAFRLSALVGARMQEGDGGSIINVSSAAAETPTPDVIPYAAAKAGLNAITIAFAHAYGPKVRVNCIQPGTFLTDISNAWDMDAFEQQAKGFALERGGQPEEIVGAALYLASDASTYTTASILRVDGGFTWPGA